MFLHSFAPIFLTFMLTARSYIKPAQCSDAEFRKMWSEFEWENKVMRCCMLTSLMIFFLDGIFMFL